MPVWLINGLVSLLTPIVQKILDKILLDIRLQQIEKEQEMVRESFRALAAAQTTEEIREAAHKLSDSWNHH